MKTILIIATTFFLSGTIYATELSWVDEQIEAIKPARKSVKIRGINDPFVFLRKNKAEKKGMKSGKRRATSSAGTKKASSKSSIVTNKVKASAFDLSTIINSTAMINGSWYKKDAKIKGYTVIEVTKTFVILKKGDKKLILSTNIKNPNLKFKNK
ncbi:MAG: hypothetical protein L3J19_06580 [Sulfurimonas sp.]|nr:hypothetical protein [Sulfurimonas sp.]